MPGSSVGKESACSAGDPGLIPGTGSSPGEGISLPTPIFLGFPGGSDGKESTCNVGDPDSIPVLRRSPGGAHGNPLQYSRLENRHGQRSLWATVHGVAESNLTKHSATKETPGIADVLDSMF